MELESSWSVGFGGAAITALLLTACGAGSPKLVGVPVQHPIGVIITATPAVQAKSDRQSMRAMADRLLEGLHDKQLTGYVAEEGQRVPPPRLELFITRWDAYGGERISSLVGTLLFGAVAAAHADDLEVECSVVREGDVTASYHHVFTGATGEELARQILHRVFTDERVIPDEVPYQRGRGGY